MKTIVSIAASAAVVVAASALVNASLAASDAGCQHMWKKCDANSDGGLADGESIGYETTGPELWEQTEGRITQAEFMDACKNDLFAPHKAETGAPLKGANSFTEGQAKDRAIAHGGVDSVSDLRKDDDGVWRGKATRAGKPVEIAIDYKGNVVTTAQQ